MTRDISNDISKTNKTNKYTAVKIGVINDRVNKLDNKLKIQRCVTFMEQAEHHWHPFETSKAIKKNKIYTRTHFNQEFICFRDSIGIVHIFDAYCPHLGAHIGVGGKIKNDQLICPFHGWQYNTQGNCVHIPYCDKIPKKAQLTAFQAIEKDGVIYFSMQKIPSH